MSVTFEVREEAVGVGQSDSIAKYGIGESIGRSGEVLEDDYGIAVKPDRFTDMSQVLTHPSFQEGVEELEKTGVASGSEAVLGREAKPV